MGNFTTGRANATMLLAPRGRCLRSILRQRRRAPRDLLAQGLRSREKPRLRQPVASRRALALCIHRTPSPARLGRHVPDASRRGDLGAGSVGGGGGKKKKKKTPPPPPIVPTGMGPPRPFSPLAPALPGLASLVHLLAGCNPSPAPAASPDAEATCPASVAETLSTPCATDGLKCYPQYECGILPATATCTCSGGLFACVDVTAKPVAGAGAAE